ncbi:hypothetical protein FQA39_LY13326 [Lamprigera yunnana]|nr:hypothetical protein FQA39_LY13326 [Lamprigera yunnana]
MRKKVDIKYLNPLLSYEFVKIVTEGLLPFIKYKINSQDSQHVLESYAVIFCHLFIKIPTRTNINDYYAKIRGELACNLRHIIPAVNTQWKVASRSKDKLLKNNNWLESEYSVTLPNSKDSTPCTSSVKRARPCVSYSDLSQSSRKKILLLNEYGFEHAYNAYLQGLRSIGAGAVAKLVKTLRFAESEIQTLFSSVINDAKQKKMLTDKEALSVFIDFDLKHSDDDDFGPLAIFWF